MNNVINNFNFYFPYHFEKIINTINIMELEETISIENETKEYNPYQDK